MATVIVQEGDSWDSIAADHLVSAAMLLMANGIDPNSTPDPLQAGSTIRLPDDPPDLCVAPGHEHAADIRADATSLWIRLAMSSSDADKDQGSLRLYSTDGTFDQTVPIAGNYVANADTIDVPFDHVDPTLTYCLDYHSAAGCIVPIVCERTVDAFQDGAAG